VDKPVDIVDKPGDKFWLLVNKQKMHRKKVKKIGNDCFLQKDFMKN